MFKKMIAGLEKADTKTQSWTEKLREQAVKGMAVYMDKHMDVLQRVAAEAEAQEQTHEEAKLIKVERPEQTS